MIGTPPSAPPSPPTATRPIAVSPGRRPTEGEPESCVAAWAMVAVMLLFKAVLIGIVYIAAGGSAPAALLLFATNWMMLIVLGMLLAVIPFGLWFRLLRARRRRRQLRQAEWCLEESPRGRGWQVS